jgi:3-phosphoglycerate kinase
MEGKPMKYIIDRIEGNIVVCENQETKKMENFKIEQFPKGIKDGDIVVLKDEKFEKDESETKNQKEKINELMKKLMKG